MLLTVNTHFVIAHCRTYLFRSDNQSKQLWRRGLGRSPKAHLVLTPRSHCSCAHVVCGHGSSGLFSLIIKGFGAYEQDTKPFEYIKLCSTEVHQSQIIVFIRFQNGGLKTKDLRRPMNPAHHLRQATSKQSPYGMALKTPNHILKCT